MSSAGKTRLAGIAHLNRHGCPLDEDSWNEPGPKVGWEVWMSSAFDIVELALRSLTEDENLTEDQRALVSAVQRVVAEWHDLNHKQDDAINLKTSPGTLVTLVDARNRLSQPGI